MTQEQSYLIPTYARQDIHFVKGLGASLWDQKGQEYLDAVAGVAVTNLGHAHPEIAQVISEQAHLLVHTSNLYGIPWQEKLAEKLCQLANMAQVFFTNSGAEANEAALKLARLQAHKRAIKQPQIVVMRNSFHGRTLATLSATDNPAIQQGFSPLVEGFIRVPYNDFAAIKTLENNSNIVAVLLEPVQGEGGVYPADAIYLQQLRQLCDQQNWLLMLDEVQTGIGRTGKWFACQHAQVIPDVMTLAKGLGNGFPIGACLVQGQATQLFAQGSHASTFGGNPLACRVGYSVLDIIQRDNVVEKSAELGRYLLEQLHQKLSANPHVKAVRGVGMMLGIELHANAKHLVARALTEQHLLINVTRNNTIRLLPALILTKHQVDQIIQRLCALLHSL